MVRSKWLNTIFKLAVETQLVKVSDGVRLFVETWRLDCRQWEIGSIEY